MTDGYGVFAGQGSFGAWKQSYGASSGGSTTDVQNIEFAANDGVSSDNPMAGHANSADIRPYNIFFLPLIAY